MSDHDFDESEANGDTSRGLSWWFSSGLSLGLADGAGSRRSQHREPLRERMLARPGTLTISYFGLLTFTITMLLLLPASSRQEGSTSFHVAFFTAISALSTCGIPVVDMTEHWTIFGQAIILIAIQMGGIGVMTFASLIMIVTNQRLRVSQQLVTAHELGTSKIGETRGVLSIVLGTTVLMEFITFLVLFPPLLQLNDFRWRRTAWESLFYAVAAFNNTGFTPDAAGLHVDHWGVGLPILISAFCGTLGFPVILDLLRSFRYRIRPRFWTLNTKITLSATFIIVGVSLAWFLLDEWNNPFLFGNADVPTRLRGALSVAVAPRTSGFDLSWVPQVSETTKVYMCLIMFIGGGSSSTAGGIRVTTFVLLVMTMISTFRGRGEVNAFHRHIPDRVLKTAVSVTMSCATVVLVASIALMQVTGRSLTDTLFETCSAFSLGGYTLGVADAGSTTSLYILAVVMAFGRIGPMTIAYAINKTRSEDDTVIHYPQEAVSVG
ncbi:TrkH family potassium uptake protein [Bifidobacterium callitrichos]|uniref:TrkH family potassium uptake protein n=1 Tax=Bifidobacterium callitrichos DSM 23973 TaxID=1437609 RepID=A0A086ZXP4_9BIFI|nr:potassium transporter TrkG [Bifidobacterium callitrichos]KFI51294.1 TrkH family potassium uptake protein [Bifidobacterium callitrichos DSM 23973]